MALKEFTSSTIPNNPDKILVTVGFDKESYFFTERLKEYLFEVFDFNFQPGYKGNAWHDIEKDIIYVQQEVDNKKFSEKQLKDCVSRFFLNGNYAICHSGGITHSYADYAQDSLVRNILETFDLKRKN